MKKHVVPNSVSFVAVDLGVAKQKATRPNGSGFGFSCIFQPVVCWA